jgi:hypothetical protein
MLLQLTRTKGSKKGGLKRKGGQVNAEELEKRSQEKERATEFSVGKLGTEECKMPASPTFRREEGGEVKFQS